MTYGTLPEGFSRKPLNVMLADIERTLAQGFGSDTIQTAASPLGQLNGMLAYLIGLVWEMGEHVYQSNDPDQATGNALNQLARIRLIAPGGFATEELLRHAVTNVNNARIGMSDMVSALTNVDGVTFAHVWTNETGEFIDIGLEKATIVPVVIGGSDDEVGAVLRRFIVPGINTFGNYRIEFLDGIYCRSVSIIRPVIVPVKLIITVKLYNLGTGCPAPSETTIIDNFLSVWDAQKLNGKDVNFFTVRTIVEGASPNVEVIKIQSSRENGPYIEDGTSIGFIEMASFTKTDIDVVFT